MYEVTFLFSHCFIQILANFLFNLLLHFLPGHTVMFAEQSGMNASGHVMLGTMDVHNQWTKVMQLQSFCCHMLPVCSSLSPDPCLYRQMFQQLPSYRSLQQQTDWLKERISLLLGGAQVVNVERLGPVQPIAEHYSILSTFHKSVMSRHLRLHPRSLQGLTMLLAKLEVMLTCFKHMSHRCLRST